jgi:hypothetical protein
MDCDGTNIIKTYEYEYLYDANLENEVWYENDLIFDTYHWNLSGVYVTDSLPNLK